MLVERGNYRHCYEIIRRDGYQTPILIYVSTSDVDALCAYRILKSMFQSDNVPFSVFPVSGSEELRKRGKEIPDDEQNRAIVLINCGGTEGVREMMDLKVNCRAYVLDSHRPLSLQNVSEENKDVYVIRDDSKEGDDYFPEMDTVRKRMTTTRRTRTKQSRILVQTTMTTRKKRQDANKSSLIDKREAVAKRGSTAGVAEDGRVAKKEKAGGKVGVLSTRVVLRSIGWVVRIRYGV